MKKVFLTIFTVLLTSFLFAQGTVQESGSTRLLQKYGMKYQMKNDATSITAIPMTLARQAGQTTDLFQITDENDNVLWSIDYQGNWNEIPTETDPVAMSAGFITAETDTLGTVVERGGVSRYPITLGSDSLSGELNLYATNEVTSGTIKLKAPDTLSLNYTLILPTALPLTPAVEFLYTNNLGQTYWGTPPETQGLSQVLTHGEDSGPFIPKFQSSPGFFLGVNEDPGSANVAGSFKLWSAGDNAYTTIITMGTQTQDINYTAPVNDGSSYDYLHTEGNGVLSWEPPASSNSAGVPAAGDCDADAERGRMHIDTANNRLYVCMGLARGWDYTALTD